MKKYIVALIIDVLGLAVNFTILYFSYKWFLLPLLFPNISLVHMIGILLFAKAVTRDSKDMSIYREQDEDYYKFEVVRSLTLMFYRVVVFIILWLLSLYV